jgi:glycosyltransferase involved in cell wall biosynthesis
MTKIQIYISTYNRPNTILNAVNSVLSQTFSSFELIVSDNSTNLETQSILFNIKDDRFKYIKRKSLYSGIEHLNIILSEITADYFMIFHDDDIMHDNMVEKLQSSLNESSYIVAIGSNAEKVKNGKKSRKLFLKSNNDILINNPSELVYRYFIKDGIVPFPSYMYRKEVSEKLRLNIIHGGKYCDVSFLIEVSKLGKIKFLSEPLMDYYFHEGQDSSSNESMQKSRLINYIISQTKMNRKSKLMKRYRIHNFYDEFCHLMKKTNYSKKRLIKIYQIILKISPLEFFPKVILKNLLNRW